MSEKIDLNADFKNSADGFMYPAEATGYIDMPDEFDEWLTEREAAAALRKSVRTLRKWRHQRVGPPYTYFGRTVKYRKPALIAHYRASEITPVRASSKRTNQA